MNETWHPFPRVTYGDVPFHTLPPTLIERNPPPRGGVSIYYVPWSRAVCKRFHDEIRRSQLVVKSLTHGSWSGNIVNRKTPRRGGFLSINSYIAICHTYEWAPWRLQTCEHEWVHRHLSHVWMSGYIAICHTAASTVYKYVVQRKWKLHTNDEWVMSHMRMSHATQANESCHTCEWVMSHRRMSHVTHANELCHTCKWVMSHRQMSHVTHANESCHTCE